MPLGSSRILSPTRLTKVDPSGPAHVVRLLNTVLALVSILPEDRIPKVQKTENIVKPEIKVESKAEETKPEGVEEGESSEEVKKEKEQTEVELEVDEDEDEVPFKEEIGTREVLGFIVMYVAFYAGCALLAITTELILI